MKKGHPRRWALVAVAGTVVCVIALSATSQVQQRVQPVTQLTVRTPVVASTLSKWQTEYTEAMKLANQLKSSGQSPELAEQIESDLKAMDEALTEYVRVSERLRHKDRALTGSLLSLQNSMQRESRLYQTLSNALRAAHDVEMATIRNMK
jgi:predicted PurR-regulated permease PerM